MPALKAQFYFCCLDFEENVRLDTGDVVVVRNRWRLSD